MTKVGLQQIWDLGRFTYRNYVKHGFVGDMYDRSTILVQASQSDRTLMSASAWADTAFPRLQTLDYHSIIPAAVYSVPMDVDNLLEVRKARCLARIASDVAKYDETVAQPFLKSERFNTVISKISAACGRDLLLTSNYTHGQFNVLDAVKDVSDAITGDFLEGFPRMGGLSDKDALEFLQMAEDLFQNRLYHSPAQSAYLSGKLPEKIQNIFKRHVSLTVPKTPQQLQQDKEDLSAFGKLPMPRKLLSYHCHREVLYGIAKFLGISVTVPRPGLPDGLIHPGSGIFFELWEDETIPPPSTPPTIPPNADESTTKKITDDAIEQASSRFSVRVLLWTPCFEGDGISSVNHQGERFCPARLRVLPQCGSEFCPLNKFNQIIQENFEKAGGDFRKQCENPNKTLARQLRGEIKLLQKEVNKYKRSGSLKGGKSKGKRRAGKKGGKDGKRHRGGVRMSSTPRLIEESTTTDYQADGMIVDQDADKKTTTSSPSSFGSMISSFIPTENMKPSAKAKVEAALDRADEKIDRAMKKVSEKAQNKSGIDITGFMNNMKSNSGADSSSTSGSTSGSTSNSGAGVGSMDIMNNFVGKGIVSDDVMKKIEARLKVASNKINKINNDMKQHMKQEKKTKAKRAAGQP